MSVTITKQLATKVLETVDAGLVKGLDEPKPGHMCMEAAVCYALGEPHNDQPSCVGTAVRVFNIRLNDARWSSNTVRTAGLRRLSLAQLGSDKINQWAFARRVALGITKEVLSVFLADRGFVRQAKACKAARTLKQAEEAARGAAVAVDDDAAADDDASYAANDAATAASYAATDAATAASYAAAAASYVVDAAAAANDAAADKYLVLAAHVAERILIAMKSPGTHWLWLAK